jgi:hypothetical protein
MVKQGDRVKMGEALKIKLWKGCAPGKHLGPFFEEKCEGCSAGHVAEFGECEGVVLGPTDYNNAKPGESGYDSAKVGPEVDVRWEPSRLRYAYDPDELVPAAPTEVWIRSGHWPTRKFPAEFEEAGGIRYQGDRLCVDRLPDVPIGATFQALQQHRWYNVTRVPPPKTFRFLVIVEVDGDEADAEKLREDVKSQLSGKSLRRVLVRDA